MYTITEAPLAEAPLKLKKPLVSMVYRKLYQRNKD